MSSAAKNSVPGAKLPDLSGLNARMQDNNERVLRFTDGLITRIDELLAAATAGDWAEARRVSARLVETPGPAFREVSEAARALIAGVDQQAATVELQRRLIRLVGRCGRAGGPSSAARPDPAQGAKPASRGRTRSGSRSAGAR